MSLSRNTNFDRCRQQGGPKNGNIYIKLASSSIYRLALSSEQCPRALREGDRVKVYLVGALPRTPGHNLRTQPGLVKLCSSLSAGIFDGVVEIKSITRGGYHAKIAVWSMTRRSILGACGGPKGLELQTLSRSSGEKIDIVQYDESNMWLPPGAREVYSVTLLEDGKAAVSQLPILAFAGHRKGRQKRQTRREATGLR